MPKYLLGNVVVKTFEVWADSPDQAAEFIVKFQEGETEEPEGGIKAVSYKLGWNENSEENPTEPRNKILGAFLDLMQNIIPGMPPITPKKKGKIIHPFESVAVSNVCGSCGVRFSKSLEQGTSCPNCGNTI